MNVMPFARYGVDFGEECRKFNPQLFTVLCLYLWNVPEDIEEVVSV